MHQVQEDRDHTVERVNTVTAPPLHCARAEREAFGRRLRDRVRRIDHDRWITGERDVIARLRASEDGRLAAVLPYRHGRMATSPFAFLRGGAAIMAPDLAALPHTGYTVQICGDAHVRNLGACASPEGRLVFDVNDFDETCRAPWEWDVKRLAISSSSSAARPPPPGASRRRCPNTVRLVLRWLSCRIGGLAGRSRIRGLTRPGWCRHLRWR
jgi:uncharacterized protein DUF2252